MNTDAAHDDPFTNRALQIYEDAKRQIGYSAHRFRQKVIRDGGLAAAKHWLRPAKETPGVERLKKHGRLDLSVEAVALQSPWNRLFTKPELATARERLKRLGYKGKFDIISTRSYWVVSPNVRNNEETVPGWRNASVRSKAVFMGYSPEDNEIGKKFAGITPGDIILIARRHDHKPQIVGFGMVQGKFMKRASGIKTPETFGSMRRLRPFVPWSRSVPADVPLFEAVRHTRALARLHPVEDRDHLKICEWMNQQLERFPTVRRPGGRIGRMHENDTTQPSPRIVSSPKNHQLDFVVQMKARVIQAIKTEAKLMEDYRRWLEKQDRTFDTMKFEALQCDAYEASRHNLLEAKSSASREHIRMAVGQLLDYAFQAGAKSGHLHKAILLPSEPSFDIIKWLDSLDIKVVWREKKCFFDNANGQFA